MTQPPAETQSGPGPEGTDAQSGTGEGSTGTETTAGTDQGSTNGTAGSTGTQSGAEESVSRSEFDALRRQLSAADQRRTAAENELRQLRDKDLPELDKLKRDNQELTAECDKLRQDLHNQAVQGAFLTETGYTWHDPMAAFQLLDRSGITLTDDGKVTGMKDAVTKLAKGSPWLVKPASATTDATANSNNTATAPPMNGRAGAQPTTDQKTLSRRFPALGTRVRPSG